MKKSVVPHTIKKAPKKNKTAEGASAMPWPMMMKAKKAVKKTAKKVKNV